MKQIVPFLPTRLLCVYEWKSARKTGFKASSIAETIWKRFINERMLINENEIKSENYAIKLGKRTFLSLRLSFELAS